MKEGMSQINVMNELPESVILWWVCHNSFLSHVTYSHGVVFTVTWYQIVCGSIFLAANIDRELESSTLTSSLFAYLFTDWTVSISVATFSEFGVKSFVGARYKAQTSLLRFVADDGQAGQQVIQQAVQHLVTSYTRQIEVGVELGPH